MHQDREIPGLGSFFGETSRRRNFIPEDMVGASIIAGTFSFLALGVTALLANEGVKALRTRQRDRIGLGELDEFLQSSKPPSLDSLYSVIDKLSLRVYSDEVMAKIKKAEEMIGDNLHLNPREFDDLKKQLAGRFLMRILTK